MDRRNFISGGLAAGGSIASLLAVSGKSMAEGISALTSVSESPYASSDFISIDTKNSSFQSLIRGFNGRWSAPNARVVYVPLSEQGVISALRAVQGAGFGRKFTVRGGGHCYEDFVYNTNVKAIIDVSLIKTVGYDKSKGVYYAQAGATNYDLQSGLIRFGKTLPGGSCWTVGLGGHIVGGGYGLLSRQHGLVIDWLSSVSLVHLRDGTPNSITVSRKSTGHQADLFWAHTGGGGGNFGIITRYEFENLPDAPISADIVNYAWDWNVISGAGPEYLIRIVRCFESLCSTLDNSAFVILKLTHKDANQIQLLVQDVKNQASGTLASKIQSKLKEFNVANTSEKLLSVAGHPFQSSLVQEQRLTWWQAVYELSGSGGPWNGKYKSAYMRLNFTNDDIMKIYKHLTKEMFSSGMKIPMENSLVQIDSYGGKINTVSRTATAVWQRDSKYKLQYQSYWPILENKAEQAKYQEANLSWIRAFYSDVYSSYGGIPDPIYKSQVNPQVDGCYINYPDVDLNNYGVNKALQLYYGGNLTRLRNTKNYWDPQNIFNNSQSIR